MARPSFNLFTLPEEHHDLRTAVRGLAEKEIAPHAAQWTSTRRMKKPRSSSVSTLRSSRGSQKLGQPVPESNFSSDRNSGVPQQTHR